MGTGEGRPAGSRLRRAQNGHRLPLIIPAIAALAIAAGSIVGTGTFLTSESANPASVFTSGNLHHTASKPGAAILGPSLLAPGQTTSGTVTIQNDGDLAGTFRLTTSNISDTTGPNGGKLSDVLQLSIVDQTTSTAVYSGALRSVGSLSAGSFAAGASHTYQFTVSFPDGGTPAGATTDDNAYNGSSMSLEFDWTELQ